MKKEIIATEGSTTEIHRDVNGTYFFLIRFDGGRSVKSMLYPTYQEADDAAWHYLLDYYAARAPKN